MSESQNATTVAECAAQLGVSEQTARHRMAQSDAYEALPGNLRKAVDTGVLKELEADAAEYGVTPRELKDMFGDDCILGAFGHLMAIFPDLFPPRLTQFRGKTLDLLECARPILEAEKPMTIRQLFYRVVSAGGLPSTDKKHYTRLMRLMVTVREEGQIPRSWIVDHLRQTLKPSSWSGLADFGDSIRDCYRKDFWASMPYHVEVFVEKDAIAGTIQPVTDEYDIRLRVCRGYSSVSFAGEIADLWSEVTKPIKAYYLGDFDPSGFDIERDLKAKLKRYSGCSFDWSRLGVGASDFDEFKLLPLAVKHTDRRARAFMAEHGGRCAEIDAIPPTELRRRVDKAIQTWIDNEKWDRLRMIEKLEKAAIEGYADKMAELNLDTVSEAVA